MKKVLFLFIILIFNCNTGDLTVIANLPAVLNEVSAVQKVTNSSLIWMLNDGGNSNKIYGVNNLGILEKEIVINAKNHDWEDLTTDEKGNLYIGDFGNNHNKRKSLSILKINSQYLLDDKNADIGRISFYYPNQKKFPAKKNKRYFDTESFFYFNDYFYLFTRSRVKGDYGKTSLYKIPAKSGNHAAEYISSVTFCKELECSITSAAISKNKKSVVLLNHSSVLLFYDFDGDDFFNGKQIEFPLKHKSQKEGVCFKDEKTLYITDEKSHHEGGKLYEFKINPSY